MLHFFGRSTGILVDHWGSRKQDIIITVNLILQKPLICSWKLRSFSSQDSYWAALWWNLYFFHCSLPLVCLGNLKLSLDLKKTISFANIDISNLLRGEGRLHCSLYFNDCIGTVMYVVLKIPLPECQANCFSRQEFVLFFI